MKEKIVVCGGKKEIKLVKEYARNLGCAITLQLKLLEAKE